MNNLDKLFDLQVSNYRLVSNSIIEAIDKLETNQIHLLINRNGKVVNYKQGKLTKKLINGIRRRKSNKRLSGLRIITFNNNKRQIKPQERNMVREYRLDNLTKINLSINQGLVIFPKVEQGRLIDITVTEMTVEKLLDFNYVDVIKKLEDQLKQVTTYQTSHGKERAILFGQKNSSVKELTNLAETAGLKVIDKIIQTKIKVDPTYYMGQGKLIELQKKVLANNINVVVFDDELTPAQHANLEDSLKVKVIDRTQLILDIFAQHAHSKEGKLQVELAQLEYLLPRLAGKGSQLSRLGGGIGTRGPGETKLEIDRRRIRKRIHRLKKELEKIKGNRKVQRKDRKDPIIALVGYTNAGKSTLLNLLTTANVKTENKLFATLDSTLRNMKLPIGRQVIMTDTVGFIKKLPHQLVAAFQATLEEVKEADLLLHVVDSNHSQLKKRMQVVYKVLRELEILDKEIITVFNKADLVADNKLELLTQECSNSVYLSAITGNGQEKLINKICQFIKKDMTTVNLELPYQQAQWVDKLYQKGKVISEKYHNNKIKIKAFVSKKLAQKLEKYQIKE